MTNEVLGYLVARETSCTYSSLKKCCCVTKWKRSEVHHFSRRYLHLFKTTIFEYINRFLRSKSTPVKTLVVFALGFIYIISKHWKQLYFQFRSIRTRRQFMIDDASCLINFPQGRHSTLLPRFVWQSLKFALISIVTKKKKWKHCHHLTNCTLSWQTFIFNAFNFICSFVLCVQLCV